MRSFIHPAHSRDACFVFQVVGGGSQGYTKFWLSALDINLCFTQASSLPFFFYFLILAYIPINYFKLAAE